VKDYIDTQSLSNDPVKNYVRGSNGKKSKVDIESLLAGPCGLTVVSVGGNDSIHLWGANIHADAVRNNKKMRWAVAGQEPPPSLQDFAV
jgi:hypothetical protein